jgi:exonuclease III
MSTLIMSNTNNKNNEVKNIKNVLLWNCNKIENKINELFYTLDKENIDIICSNETKLEKDFEAAILNHPNYNYVVKSRNKFGGGVRVIIKKHIKYEEIEEIKKLN